jgi:hypothetical protein
VAIPQKQQTFRLPSALREISGMEYINDSTLLAVNDGGNRPEIFVLDTDGTLRKKVRVLGVFNRDWEDMAFDGTHVYIGDFGNNRNTRKDLCVYKIRGSDIITQQEVTAEKISFRYKEQNDFPPSNDEKIFDAEALACYNGELWIFTKANTTPWTGKSLVYRLPNIPGKYVLSEPMELYMGSRGWWADAVTGVDVLGDVFYILTYNRVTKMKFAKNKFILNTSTKFSRTTQMESITIKKENEIYVADEDRTIIGGGKLYLMTTKDD